MARVITNGLGQVRGLPPPIPGAPAPSSTGPTGPAISPQPASEATSTLIPGPMVELSATF
jgi:hypothetical protein